MRVVPFIIGLAIFTHANEWGADWMPFGFDDEERVYLCDIEGIRQISKGIIRVWVKMAHTPKGIEKQVEEFGLKYKELSHNLTLFELNCTEKKFKSLMVTYYSKKGAVIEDWDFEAVGVAKWEFIPPDSFIENLYKAVCK